MRAITVHRAMGGLAGAACLFTLSQCGGGSSASPGFIRDLRSAEASVHQTTAALAGVLRQASHQTDRRLAARLSPLASSADAEANQVETLRPPLHVATAFNAWRSALIRRATDLHAVVAGLEAHNAQAARQATQFLLQDSASAVSAQKAVDSGLS